MKLFDKLFGTPPPSEERDTSQIPGYGDTAGGFEVAGQRAPREAMPENLVQGTLLDSSITVAVDSRPINSGAVAPYCTSPMWQGMAIKAFPEEPYGFRLEVARCTADICGFTVVNDSTEMVRTDLDPVPKSLPNMGINFVFLGCGQRLVLAADDAVVFSLSGGSPLTQLSWDFGRQCLIPYSAVIGQLRITRIIGLANIAWTIDPGGRCWDSLRGAVIVQL